MQSLIKLFIFFVCTVIFSQFYSIVAFGKEHNQSKLNNNFLEIDAQASVLSPGRDVVSGASREFFSRIKNAFKKFYDERDYKAAAELFDGLIVIAQQPSDKNLFFGLRNASLYALGQHSKGLDLICEDYSGLPQDDYRYLFDIHAHARKIALNSGYEAAIETMLHYKNKCHRDDFSPVWAGIPLVKMELLKAQIHVMDEPYTLPIKDRITLLQILKEFANDPYIDYAHYFLHKFDMIKRIEILQIPRKNEAVNNIDRPNYMQEPDGPFRELPSDFFKADVPLQRVITEMNQSEGKPISVFDVAKILKNLQAAGRTSDSIILYNSLPDDLSKEFLSPVNGGLRNEIFEESYLRHQIGRAPENLRQLLTKAVTTGGCGNPDECQLVAQWFPNSITARNILVNRINASWRKAIKDQETGYQDLKSFSKAIVSFSRQSTSVDVKNYAKELNYILAKSEHLSLDQRRILFPIYFNRRCTTTSECLKFLDFFKDSQHSCKIALRQMEDLIYGGLLNEFIEFYDKLPVSMQNILIPSNKQFLGDRQKHFVDIRQYLLRHDIDGLLKFAIKIRGSILKRDDPSTETARYPLMARALFSFISREYPKTLLGEKAHFLLFTVNAYRIREDDSKRILEQFIALYPNSTLIDDAYAELALLNLRWYGDKELARFYFDKVWKEYPESNAADNALYHLANMELDRGQYTRAMYYYSKVLLNYGLNRLGKMATNDYSIVKGAYQAVRDRLILEGLVLSSHGSGNHVVSVDPLKIKSSGPIMVNDRLASLDGKEIESREIFLETLAKHQAGVSVPAIFERMEESPNGMNKKTIKATVYIGQTSIFDVSFVSSNDKLSMRAEPHYKSREVGAIPHNGKCIRYLGATSVQGENNSPWFKVSYAPPNENPIVGWVNGLFLRPSRNCIN